MPQVSPRIATALVGIPIVAALIYFGGWPFRAVVALLAFLALGELQKALRHSPKLQNARLVAPFAYPALALILFFGPNPVFWSAFPLVLLVLAVVLFGSKVQISLASVALTLLTTFYVGLFAFLPLLRESKNGFQLFWLTILGVWSGDTAAYFAGRAWGKKKLTTLSPGKTREGALASVGATLITVLVIAGTLQIPFATGLAIGVAIALAAPLGDLAESFWKRELGIKDLGTLLPGHGGVLDRCDSLLFAAWAVWLIGRVGQ